MQVSSVLITATATLVLSVGVAHAEYIKAAPSAAARAEAYCNMVASGAQQGYFAFGNSSYVAGAALGNAIGNMIRVSEAKKNCMMMQGYVWKKPARTSKIAAGGRPEHRN